MNAGDSTGLENRLLTERDALPSPPAVKTGAPNLLDALAREPSLAAKLRAAASGGDGIVFELVAAGGSMPMRTGVARRFTRC